VEKCQLSLIEGLRSKGARESTASLRQKLTKKLKHRILKTSSKKETIGFEYKTYISPKLNKAFLAKSTSWSFNKCRGVRTLCFS